MNHSGFQLVLGCVHMMTGWPMVGGFLYTYAKTHTNVHTNTHLCIHS